MVGSDLIHRLSALAHQLAQFSLPEELELALRDDGLGLLDKVLFEPSELPQQRRVRPGVADGECVGVARGVPAEVRDAIESSYPGAEIGGHERARRRPSGHRRGR